MTVLVLRNSFVVDDRYVPGGRWEGWPCEGTITQVFGKLSVTGSTHAGVDIGVVSRTPLYAWADGVVQNLENPSFGRHVYLRHGRDDILERDLNGIAGHCDEINIVPSGKAVAAGELIAYSGNTGLSTGPHVHLGFGAFQISGDYRQCVDPYLLIKRAEIEEDLPMAPYERGLLSIAFGDPTVMSTVYDGLDAAGFFAAVNASDGPAGPIAGPDALNNSIVRMKRIGFLATDTVNGPPAWEAVN